MGSLKEREEAFENLFARDQEQMFRARARRNMNLAAWAAQLMSYSAEDIAVYVNEIVALDLLEGKDEPIVQRIQNDLKGSGHDVDEQEISTRMTRLMEQACADLKSFSGKE